MPVGCYQLLLLICLFISIYLCMRKNIYPCVLSADSVCSNFGIVLECFQSCFCLISETSVCCYAQYRLLECAVFCRHIIQQIWIQLFFFSYSFHIINGSFRTQPQRNQQFCSDCGAPTIHTCPHCGREIPGDYAGDFCYAISWDVPNYCGYCGKPFPWTESAIESASLIIKEETELSEELKQQVTESIPDIVSETPRTTLAAVRIKKVLSSGASITAEMLRQFVIDFGCELVKNSLGL